MKGSHRSVAVCNDCHVPHNFVGKYYTKARNGFWHSFYFTTQTFHEPIRATPGSRRVTEAACRYCHAAVVQAMGTPAHAGSAGHLVHPLPRLRGAHGAFPDVRRDRHEVSHG